MATMKISECIKVLQRIEKERGDLKVYMSRDEEGNGFGTLSDKSFDVTRLEDGTCVILFPWEEYVEPEA